MLGLEFAFPHVIRVSKISLFCSTIIVHFHSVTRVMCRVEQLLGEKYWKGIMSIFSCDPKVTTFVMKHHGALDLVLWICLATLYFYLHDGKRHKSPSCHILHALFS